MTATVSGRIWDDASAPPAVRLVRRFEADWAASAPGRRPDPTSYLPAAPESRAASRLALLRAEMALKRTAGEPADIENYLSRFPDLDDETFVALIYEEICLREDDGERPEPLDYLARFPQVADRLRRILDIHDLVGSARTVSLPSLAPSASTPTFPEVGQTIAGFHLVAELGRGSFARVFRAQERQLADRPVALKVARTGSREPQTLARLQHTHIVPVHSYRIDPVTGLHLLCMPYLGGLTLDRLLADSQVRQARDGGDLLAALDRLGAGDDLQFDHGAANRRMFHALPVARVIAWWGARMAEALQHAHERGVLHRDIKPSNVLVTGDGAPMLLDFNLAWESHIEDPEVEATGLGGTVAYMSPEHLEAVAEGNQGGVDARSDIYSLGVLLYEAMGTRPFAAPEAGRSVIESLMRTASLRRAGPRRLRLRHPEVPPEFEAVVMKCLEPEPADRYPDAASLAADLQAVADDAPLRTAREPMPSRAERWLRRNRLRLAVAVPLALAPTVVVFGLASARLERAHLTGQLIGQVEQLLEEGRQLIETDQIVAAEARFDTASTLAAQSEDAAVLTLQAKARDRYRYAMEIERIRTAADRLFAQVDPLKLRLLGFTGPVGDPSAVVERALSPFYVLSDEITWTESSGLTLLDADRKTRLFREVDTLLFLWAVALANLDDPVARDEALTLCRRALTTTDQPAPWQALQGRLAADTGLPGPGASPPHPFRVESSRACFLWGVLSMHEQRAGAAIDWLSRATRLDVDQYWYHYYLGYVYQKVGDDTRALGHYDVAIALRSDLPWPRFNRARLYQARGAWSRALEDLEAALATTEPRDRPPVLLNLALVREALGDLGAARSAYEAILAAVDATDPLRHAARLNRARLDAEEGDVDRALTEYEALMADAPSGDLEARFGRALIRLRNGQPVEALTDLDHLLSLSPENPTWLAYRAEALLESGRAEEAIPVAETVLRHEPTLARQRLRDRLLIAAGRLDTLHLDRPETLLRLTPGIATLRADFARAAENLDDSENVRDLLNLAIFRSALGEHRAAEAAATRALDRAKGSARVHLIRARVRNRAGDRAGALMDIAIGLEIEPSDPSFLALRGELRIATDPRAALADLDAARRLGAGRTVHRHRAQALAALGRHENAIAEWTETLREDPEDPAAYLDRARALIALGLWDQALADLEKAAAWAGPRTALMFRIAMAYCRCLPARPDHLPRVVSLTRRSVQAARPEFFQATARLLAAGREPA